MKKILFGASGLALVAAGAVQAQDYYIGGEIGLTDHSATFEDRDYDWYGHTQDFDTTGLSFGGFAGTRSVNQNQLSGWELGARVYTNDERQIFASDVQVDTALRFSASLTHRRGIAVDGTSLYVLGGVTVANTDRSWTEFNDVADTWPDLGDTKTGVVLGFGIERRLNDRWSVRGQFTSSSFGENVSINADDYPLHIRDRVNTVSLGFTYDLGEDAPPSIHSSTEGTAAQFAGFYGGAQIDLATGRVSQSDIDYDYWGGSYDIASEGLVAGLSFGRNWQSGATVLGLEARVQTTGLSASNSHAQDDYTSSTSIDQMASLRARAGTVIGNNLVYVVGGVTSADVENLMYEDASGRYTGLVVGMGLETMVSSRLSWSAEASYTLFDGNEDDAGSGYYGTADLLQVSAGVNYHLGAEERRTGSGVLRPTRDWSGLFYGLDVAALANQGTVQDDDYDDYGGDFDLISLGGGVGAHAGRNWQSGSFVYGAVLDAAVFSNSEARTSGFRTADSKLNSMVTFRGRAGIATGSSYLYVTGGVAVADSTLTHDGSSRFDMSDTRLGGVVGMGVEHALSDAASIKVETLFAKFDQTSAFNGDTCTGPVGFDGGLCNMDGYDTNTSIKAGMSFKF